MVFSLQLLLLLGLFSVENQKKLGKEKLLLWSEVWQICTNPKIQTDFDQPQVVDSAH